MPMLTYLSMHSNGQSQAFTIFVTVGAFLVIAVFIGVIIAIIRDSKKH